MTLSCQDIKKTFGERVVLQGGSFHIEEREKAALVGVNGAGKSTLLKIIMGEIFPESGRVSIPKEKTLGYLSQNQTLSKERTIYQEARRAREDLLELEEKIRAVEKELKDLTGEALKSRLLIYHRLTASFEAQNGYAYESEIAGVLKGLGFSENEFGKSCASLSGGEKTRVSLGRLLLAKPDILLLDEPTNHLDLPSISWLENYLLAYQGAALIVSHDRYFLNRVVTRVVEIEQGNILSYTGNYEAYAQKKERQRETLLREYLNRQREIKHQEEVIERLRSFNREKSIRRAQSREKLLSKLEPAKKPFESRKLHFLLKPSVLSGRDVLTAKDLSKSFAGKVLFEKLNFEIKRGEHIAVIGANGTGKTTLLKILNQAIQADAGSFTLGANVTIGYYDQEHNVLHMEKTIFEEISDAYPKLTHTEIRSTLAAFLFTGEDVFKRIGDLSGGERGRVSLAKLMLSEANFLILDEPTNHLDIDSKEILEGALNDYEGTVLYVSHDRYFINRTAGRILALANHTLTNYLGDYDYYLEKKEDELSPQNLSPTATDKVSPLKQSWQEQKEAQAKERKRQNEFKRTEEDILALEEREKELDALLVLEEIYTDSLKCQEISKEREAIEKKLEDLYKKWEELAP